jgi:hypothetical protein
MIKNTNGTGMMVQFFSILKMKYFTAMGKFFRRTF